MSRIVETVEEMKRQLDTHGVALVGAPLGRQLIEALARAEKAETAWDELLARAAKAETERDVAIGQRNEAIGRAESAEAHRLAVAEAVGVVHEGDGFAPVAGPNNIVISAIKALGLAVDGSRERAEQAERERDAMHAAAEELRAQGASHDERMESFGDIDPFASEFGDVETQSIHDDEPEKVYLVHLGNGRIATFQNYAMADGASAMIRDVRDATVAACNGTGRKTEHRVELLDCPSCGSPCENMPPNPPEDGIPFAHWVDGDEGACECGAEVMVSADSESSPYLVERTGRKTEESDGKTEEAHGGQRSSTSVQPGGQHDHRCQSTPSHVQEVSGDPGVGEAQQAAASKVRPLGVHLAAEATYPALAEDESEMVAIAEAMLAEPNPTPGLVEVFRRGVDKTDRWGVNQEADAEVGRLLGGMAGTARRLTRPPCIPSHIPDTDWTVIEGRAVWREEETLFIDDGGAPPFRIEQYHDWEGWDSLPDGGAVTPVPQPLFLAARRWMGWERTLTAVDLTELREVMATWTAAPAQITPLIAAVEKLLSSGGAP